MKQWESITKLEKKKRRFSSRFILVRSNLAQVGATLGKMPPACFCRWSSSSLYKGIGASGNGQIISGCKVRDCAESLLNSMLIKYSWHLRLCWQIRCPYVRRENVLFVTGRPYGQGSLQTADSAGLEMIDGVELPSLSWWYYQMVFDFNEKSLTIPDQSVWVQVIIKVRLQRMNLLRAFLLKGRFSLTFTLPSSSNVN